MKATDQWLPTIALVGLSVLVTNHVVTTRFLERYPTWAMEDFHAELTPLVERYGTEKVTQYYEEHHIRDYFQDRRDGVFLDVGASHYKESSNTFYLETVLNWSGLAIEPQTEYAADYAVHRPRTRFVPMFASNVADRTVQLFVTPDAKRVASATASFTERWGATRATTVPTTTLNVVLDQAGISRVDFVSLDIELHEPQALAGFDIQRFRPALVCVEAHPEVRQQILDYFNHHGYGIVGKYLRSDVKNLYFQPR